MDEQKQNKLQKEGQIKQYMHLRVKWMIDFRIKTFKFDNIHKQGSTLKYLPGFLIHFL